MGRGQSRGLAERWKGEVPKHDFGAFSVASLESCRIERLMSELDALPHGPEFRFVDELVSLDPGKQAVGRYLIRGDEGFLAGHFPGNPLMPGVILIEAIAQLGGVVAQSDPEVAPLDNLLLTGVRGAKILGAAVPGEVASFVVE